MAVDVCNEIPSPRISFSYDLNHTPADHHVFPLKSSDPFPTIDFDFDFDFCISAAQQISSADELFSNGKILPTQIKKTQQEETHQPKPNNSSQNHPMKKPLKDFLFQSSNEEDDYDQEQEQEQEKQPLSSKSFWKFTRSTSLNFDNAKGKGLLRKLQKLSRSNSTGSAPISKQTQPPKVVEKQSSQKQHHQPVFTRSSSCSNSYYYAYNSSKRPPLKKNCRGNYNGNGNGIGNGIRISPVLNIPPGYGSMSLFGLGSLFCNGKDKRKKK